MTSKTGKQLLAEIRQEEDRLKQRDPASRLAMEYRKQFGEEPPNDIFIMRRSTEEYLRLMKKVMETGDKSHWYEDYPWDIINDPNKFS